MRIHTDHNGVAVNAIHSHSDGRMVEGHEYQILSGPLSTTLNFQQGGVAQNGVNGITNEALIAVLMHRIGFLNKLFPSPENAKALDHLQGALDQLELRTARRMTRGVEGQEVA